MPVKPRRFTAKLSYRGQPFVSVPIEVSNVEAGNADQFDTLTSDALGLVGVPAAEPVKPFETCQAACSVSVFSFGGSLIQAASGSLGGAGLRRNRSGFAA
ncbi:hypothetical protein NIIDMKKI_23380 [Mycobacterium kansasii]|uniref:Uncharacterized protein n=1 Tax=Mycobacterium kansasii TaxID=1768 RepID=A0A7G1IBA7_MYCKA|nr:hypothetical protein NIIDMKKI_23380 [Mycobacterium kansasii]